VTAVGRALDGIVVLDLGQVYNGPYCGMLLQRLGATVIKLEPADGESLRWRSGGQGTNQAFLLLNAGKRGLRLDLKNPRGHEIFLRLVDNADVVIENFAPGVMERLGLGDDALSARNPRLVIASGKGYSSTGPNRNLRGMDITVQAMTAVVATTGFPDGPPTKAGPAVVDFAAGTHLVAGVLAALFQRERTGCGQRVEVSMQEAILPALASNIAGFLDSDGDFPDRTGNRHGGHSVCPYNIYPTADGWIAVICLRDRHWRQLCALMGRRDLDEDPALRTTAGRAARMDDIDEAVRTWTTPRTKQELFDALDSAGIPCAPVQSLREVVTDPVLAQSGMLRSVGSGERAGMTFGSPLHLADSDDVDLTPAPLLGEHSSQILREMLGFDDGALESLTDDGVI
jgi:crotonobetainyl-CoA:carnitine CoA-transferase CaiB-like acyl-CoA transferase